jgi:DNA modification methylase
MTNIHTAETRIVKLTDMKPAKYNPRKDLQPGDPEFEKLRNSIKKFGYLDRIIWNDRTGNIVGGHQRYKVLSFEGIAEAEVTVVSLNDDDEKALNVALNKISGDWDEDLLAELLNDLEQNEYDMDLTGFDQEEIDNYLDKYTDNQDVEEEEPFDPEEEVEMIIEPYVQTGDLWILGPHRLKCGDSLNEQDVAAAADGQTMDLVITDPPYNVNYESSSGMKIDNDHMADQEFRNFLFEAFSRMLEITKKGGPIYIFHADSEGYNFRGAMKDAGWDLKQNLVWVKNSIVLGRQDYHWQHEPVLYGWRPGAAHFWNGERDKSTIIDDEVKLKDLDKPQLIELINELRNHEKTTVTRVSKPRHNDEHPTMKPPRIIRQYLKNSSMRGHRVWDSFMGSGSTLIAADQIGRIAHGTELDRKYAQVVVERYIRHKGNDNEVYVIRDGKQIPYAEAATAGYTEIN